MTVHENSSDSDWHSASERNGHKPGVLLGLESVGFLGSAAPLRERGRGIPLTP